MSEDPQHPETQKPAKEPYPRMIIVCIIISMTLLLVIFTVILVDMIQRSEGIVQAPDPAAFERMLEKPRAPYTGDSAPAQETP
ncbi:MAG: hypothetical protein GC168_17675 [Candidatus Hydrogenedens sp.]|nr:hypothetical protein [Candidatus Hydrogenedens sp.]